MFTEFVGLCEGLFICFKGREETLLWELNKTFIFILILGWALGVKVWMELDKKLLLLIIDNIIISS